MIEFDDSQTDQPSSNFIEQDSISFNKSNNYEYMKQNIIKIINKNKSYLPIKRILGILASLLFIGLFWWLFLLIAVIIKIDDPNGPVIFKQTRVGINGSSFKIYKFRTMCADAEKQQESLQSLNEKEGPVFKIKNDPRILKSGVWLRKLSLDELPQFINVIKGDLAIVGPRPALPDEVAKYSQYDKLRLLVKPGITCFWQTRKNRDAIPFDEWVKLDLLYIKKMSLLTDLKIIIQTVGVVLTAQGS